VGIGVASRDGRVLAANEAMCRITGYPAEELPAVNIGDTYLTPGQRDEVLRQLDRDGLVRNLEVALKRRDGTPYVGRLTITPIRLGGEDLLLTAEEDVTDQKRAKAELGAYQERLRSLASQLSLAEEQERRRIASDLHDSVGQLLAIASMRLGVLQQKPYSAEFAQRLQDINKWIDQAARTVQSLIFELSPPVLYELGLGAAAERLAEQTHEQHGLEVVVQRDGDSVAMTNDVRSLLFKAVREMLMNVVKHAKATRAEVRIKGSKDGVLVEVVDNGVGFDVEQLDPRRDRARGFGLFNVRERLEHLGGNLSIDSAPGKGTVVAAALPLDDVTCNEEEAGT
jgi:PAS domain S-box-containing protein